MSRDYNEILRLEYQIEDWERRFQSLLREHQEQTQNLGEQLSIVTQQRDDAQRDVEYWMGIADRFLCGCIEQEDMEIHVAKSSSESEGSD